MTNDESVVVLDIDSHYDTFRVGDSSFYDWYKVWYPAGTTVKVPKESTTAFLRWVNGATITVGGIEIPDYQIIKELVTLDEVVADFFSNPNVPYGCSPKLESVLSVHEFMVLESRAEELEFFIYNSLITTL